MSINLVWTHCRGLAKMYETDAEDFWAEVQVVCWDKRPKLNHSG